jgi:hypothetical protein
MHQGSIPRPRLAADLFRNSNSRMPCSGRPKFNDRLFRFLNQHTLFASTSDEPHPARDPRFGLLQVSTVDARDYSMNIAFLYERLDHSHLNGMFEVTRDAK